MWIRHHLCVKECELQLHLQFVDLTLQLPFRLSSTALQVPKHRALLAIPALWASPAPVSFLCSLLLRPSLRSPASRYCKRAYPASSTDAVTQNPEILPTLSLNRIDLPQISHAQNTDYILFYLSILLRIFLKLLIYM